MTLKERNGAAEERAQCAADCLDVIRKAKRYRGDLHRLVERLLRGKVRLPAGCQEAADYIVWEVSPSDARHAAYILEERLSCKGAKRKEVKQNG